jgi:hypothetical protein
LHQATAIGSKREEICHLLAADFPRHSLYWLLVPSVRKMDRLPLQMRSFLSLFSSRDAIHTGKQKISFPASASDDNEAHQ